MSFWAVPLFRTRVSHFFGYGGACAYADDGCEFWNLARVRFGRNMELSTQWWLLAIGFVGQGFFFMRFLWQWIVSEREKKSVIPICFWYFSLLGSFFLLIYAVLRSDIVFIVGQSTGSIIYVRNLYLIHRERNRSQSLG